MEAMQDFVAATLFWGPACRGMVKSAIPPPAMSASFTMAMTFAPPCCAALAIASRSGLRPDCEITSMAAPSRRSGV